MSPEKQIDISLIQLPSRGFSAKYRPPIGYMYMASYAEREGLEVDIIDIKPSVHGYAHESYQVPTKSALENITGQIIVKLKQTRPLIAGIGCFSVEYKETIELAKRIKAELKDIFIVVGGIHPTISPDDFIFEETPVDFVVIGEGERTLAELAKAIKNNKDVSEVKGVLGFENGKVFRTESQPLIQDLDAFPLPAFDKIDMAFYTSPNPFTIRGMLLSTFLLLSGRGCPYNCTFCASKAIRGQYKNQRFVRFRDVEKIVDEIELLVNKYSIDAFYFIDDTFTMKRERVFEFCDQLKARNLNLLWACSTRVDVVSEKMLTQMRDAGCMQIDFGVESGSPSCLKTIKKGITVEHIKSAFEICRKLGVRTLANYMFNIPGETEEDVNETFSLIRQIKPSVSMVGVVTAYPGTEIYNTLGPRLTKEELNPAIFRDDRINIARDTRFRYTKHNLDLASLRTKANREFNTLWNSLKVFFDHRYILQVLKSRRKLEYIKQAFSSVKIWFAQRKRPE